MIKFFRKIRLKLLSENKFSKYLIYAIGEIVLVVIGILIALQINNWNELNKQSKNERKYLERLVIDLGIDSAYYERRITEIDLGNKDLKTYVQKSYKTQKNIEEVKQLFNHLYVNTDHLTVQNSTYKELISSGQINILKNESVKKTILEYYGASEEFGVQIKEFNLVTTEFLIETFRVVRNQAKFMPYWADTYNDSKMYLDGGWDFINHPNSEKFQAIESMANMYHLRNTEHLTYYHKLRLLSNDLKKEIKRDFVN